MPLYAQDNHYIAERSNTKQDISKINDSEDRYYIENIDNFLISFNKPVNTDECDLQALKDESVLPSCNYQNPILQNINFDANQDSLYDNGNYSSQDVTLKTRNERDLQDTTAIGSSDISMHSLNNNIQSQNCNNETCFHKDDNNICFNIESFNINSCDETQVKNIHSSFLQQSNISQLNELIDKIIKYNGYIDQKQYDHNVISKIINDINVKHDESKYIIKDINLNWKDLKKDNEMFIKQQKEKSDDIQYKLTEKQKLILKKMDPSFFPKTLKPDICKLIDKQMSKYKNTLLQSKTEYHNKRTTYLPVFVPKYINKNPHNIKNDFFTIAKLIKLGQLKVQYITLRHMFRVTRHARKSSYSEYLVTCANKISKINEPTIFVLIPDDMLNEKMEIDYVFDKYTIRFLEYTKILNYTDFLYGCYKFIVEDVKYFDSHRNYFGKKCTLNNLLKNDIYRRYALKKADVYKKFQEIQKIIRDKFLIRPREILQISLNEKIKTLLDTNLEFRNFYEQKQKYDFVQVVKENIYDKFADLKKIIDQKFHEEKGKTYNVDKLIELYTFFNKHSFAYHYYPKICNNIISNIHEDIKSMNSNYDSKYSSKSAFIFAPLSWDLSNINITPAKRKKLLEKMLKDVVINKYSFCNLYKCVETNKVLIALTEDIDINDVLKNNKVLLFMPQTFDIDCCPLFDPNKLSIHGYFYKDFSKQKAQYPLYEFNLYSQLKNTQNRDRTKTEYTTDIPDIDNFTLEEYLVYAYTMFYERAKAVLRGL